MARFHRPSGLRVSRAAVCVSFVLLAFAGTTCKQASRSFDRTPEPQSIASSTVSAIAAGGPAPSVSVAPSTSASGIVPAVHYGMVTLAGTLTEQTFFGPPGYGSDPTHDAKEQAIVLMLFVPIDVLRSVGDDDFDEDRLGVRKVQIATTKDSASDLHKLIGRPSKVKGKLVGAHGGRHHTDVVLVEGEVLAE